jgi:beta-glucosidase
MNNSLWKDFGRDFDERVGNLVAQMTLEEKVSQMLYTSFALTRFEIPEYNWWNECLHGVARAGTATVFPQAIGLAAMFDREMMYNVADIISDEARIKHHIAKDKEDFGIYKGLTYWSPNINIVRDPRWGRGQETYGEDPYLTAEMGIQFCKGLQGNDKKYLKLAATVKHFAAHSGPEADRHHFNAIVSAKDMEETYLYAFERIIKEGGVASVMGAYNRINGEACCASDTLLQGLLREIWNFDGYVVSDCGAIQDIWKDHKLVDTPEAAAALAVRNGCDLNCGHVYEALIQAVQDGLLSEEEIDISVSRLLLVRMKLGMFDPDECVKYAQISIEKLDSDEHHAISYEAAVRSMVLLKNDGLLPLKKDSLKTVAVIGPNADSEMALLGNYFGTPSVKKTILTGIREALPDARILYSQGSVVDGNPPEFMWGETLDSRISEAVNIAERADVVVLCLGLDCLREGEESGNTAEGGDKLDLQLPLAQQMLLEAVSKVDTPIVFVGLVGSAMDYSFAKENVNAIVQAWYPGQMGGKALADLLLGVRDFSGRLPITFYGSFDDLPAFDNYSMEGRTYRYYEGQPQFSFGYGLSYANFEYSDLMINNEEIDAGDFINVCVKVKNISARAGAEVVQIYLEDVKASVRVPHYSLVGFERVVLNAGEKKEICFEITPEMMSVVREDGSRIIEEGEFKLYVGGSQPDKQSAKLRDQKCMKVEFKAKSSKMIKAALFQK